MSNNHLDIKVVCKLLVASCVCVAKVRTHVFNAFVSSAKRIHLLLDSWFRTHLKRTKTREKFLQNSISSRDGLKRSTAARQR